MQLVKEYKFRSLATGNVVTAIIEHRPAKAQVILELFDKSHRAKKVHRFKDKWESGRTFSDLCARPIQAAPPGFEVL
jgi:hypothetical protein